MKLSLYSSISFYICSLNRKLQWCFVGYFTTAISLLYLNYLNVHFLLPFFILFCFFKIYDLRNLLVYLFSLFFLFFSNSFYAYIYILSIYQSSFPYIWIKYWSSKVYKYIHIEMRVNKRIEFMREEYFILSLLRSEIYKIWNFLFSF